MTALVAAIVALAALLIGVVLGVFGVTGTIVAAFALAVGSVIMAFLPAL